MALEFASKSLKLIPGGSDDYQNIALFPCVMQIPWTCLCLDKVTQKHV